MKKHVQRPAGALVRPLVVSALALACALGVVRIQAAIGASPAPTDPAVSFTTQVAGPVTGTLALAGTAQATAGVKSVEVRVDEQPYQPAAGTDSWSFSLDTTAFLDGSHDVKARVTDAAGKQSWADLQIVIANQAALAPKIAFSAPGSGAKIRKKATIRGTASAVKGIARVELRVDSGPYYRVSGRDRWSTRLDTTQYLDGRHKLTVRVTDADGRQTVSTRAVMVDNHKRQIYWGALVSGALYGDGNPPADMRSLRTFERHAGKGVSILALGANWGSKQPNFPTGGMDAIREHGSIPLFSWGSMARAKLGTEQPRYRLSNIIHGKFDAYIRRFARAAKAWGHPFFLRLDWEMNLQGTYPWIETVNGNHRGEFVKMWRHVHDVFTKVGASNVTWVWCPNAEYSTSLKPLSSVYPGDRYVDWTCIDGYNWGSNPWRRNIWQTFPQVIGPTYSDIVGNIAPSKPVMIGETASSEFGGSKADWIRDTLSVQVPDDFRHIKAFIWFNIKDKADWQIETSPAATAAFRKAIGSKFYASNVFRLLGPAKIRPLTP
jgi:beta-mannanase